ncbi:DUF962 domain-containing protein [Mucilaginibacter pallidiroseus]|uniref:DUF962 domain-containing protein n=1 Tax=Mucilaginibacter pallidiroseus TaxID=2599295 RepID=A0A563UDL9_9SPHI|nr:Mpo1-like protein [Mucilaginibacter pallidiroseus]TWR29424.1 DUF962 domain-containing protein [Mucilaginibacter pallidiroseus]
MAKQHSKNIKPATPQQNLRPVEVYFNRLNASHKHPTNRLLHFICVPLMLFGILTIAWAIPFPYIKFLGPYNGYFNWASFLIAFSVYYTLKLSSNLSYMVLLVLFALSYGVSQLAVIELKGGLPLIWTGTFILAAAFLGQYIGGRIENNPRSFADDKELVLITPIWVLHFLAEKIGLKY